MINNRNIQITKVSILQGFICWSVHAEQLESTVEMKTHKDIMMYIIFIHQSFLSYLFLLNTCKGIMSIYLKTYVFKVLKVQWLKSIRHSYHYINTSQFIYTSHYSKLSKDSSKSFPKSCSHNSLIRLKCWIIHVVTVITLWLIVHNWCWDASDSFPQRNPLNSSSSSLPSIEFEILHLKNDLIVITSRILSHALTIHSQTNSKPRCWRFPNFVVSSSPLTIHSPHNLRIFNLKGFFTVMGLLRLTSNDCSA